MLRNLHSPLAEREILDRDYDIVLCTARLEVIKICKYHNMVSYVIAPILPTPRFKSTKSLYPKIMFN